MGGGLAGLSAGYVLSSADKDIVIFEGEGSTGGLARTIVRGDFRFDLGGHRFFTKNRRIEGFVKDLLGDEISEVPRSSKIYLLNKFFDYPLRPANAFFGLGPGVTFKILTDYFYERLRRGIRPQEVLSLEDWVVANFGRTMFELYFRQYSEKVWGLPCDKISAEWVSQRIKGLSLGKAIKNAFLKFSKDLPTLAERFLYPSLGIGRISERLEGYIRKKNNIFTNSIIERIVHNENKIEGIFVKNHNSYHFIRGHKFISTIPITTLITSLHPKPPEEILNSASLLRYRSLVIVAIFLNRPKVTDQTWIYIPEKRIPFGRIHEPTNWSKRMAPDGKTLIVTEYFCNKDDEVWRSGDSLLIENTISYMEEIGFLKHTEVINGDVVRVPTAYPILDIEYKRHYSKIIEYLGRFQNLFLAGRVGMFRYYNMDSAIESGIEAAEKALKN